MVAQPRRSPADASMAAGTALTTIVSRAQPGLALLCLFSVFAVGVRGGPLPGDELLAEMLAPHRRGGFRDVFAVANQLASIQVWSGIVVWTGLVLWLSHRRKAAILLVLAATTGEVVALVAKWLVARPRPPGAHLVDVIATNSYPSGHVTRATVALALLTALLIWDRPRWRWPSVAVMSAILLLVGAARVAVGDHWPSDVLGGYFLGLAWANIMLVSACWLGARRSFKQGQRPTAGSSGWGRQGRDMALGVEDPVAWEDVGLDRPQAERRRDRD